MDTKKQKPVNNNSLVDAIMSIKPHDTPILVRLAMKQGLSEKEAWKQYREMKKREGNKDYGFDF